ncbi:DNA-binding GntR family transcriptional regulator [Paenibacillus aceris]|uniref:DNA-binding GntR family transcriptional regulator n=2 Tax=Paenibacillus aceris TaxID=869555 RepID=A0ABS4I6W0_9BACL|nr:DNA-binding GntR family transcriptional regulator [Paenibacillus aceris]
MDMKLPVSSRDNKGLLIRDHVYNTLKNNIMELKLEPGRLISEKEVIEMLQVSKTPIREALVLLAQEDLIETVPQKGTYISLIDLSLVEEARFVRETMEREIVRRACQDLKTEQIMQLQHLHSLQQLCVEEKNYERFFELDEEFHRTIIVGCGKPHTWSMLEQMNVHYNRVRILRLADDEDWRLILEQHQAIIQAIREKDPDRAEKVMGEHLSRVRYEKEELKIKYPTYFK